MIDLNDVGSIKEADKGQVAASIESLPDQISQAWREARAIEFAAGYKNCTNLIIAGMGGSCLGPELVSYLYRDKIKIPLQLVRDYNLPAFADQNTLVILSSYSGTTEETLSVGKEALVRGCKITAITEGRALGEFLAKNNLPAYIFKAQYNPSEQPRLGLGYSVGGVLGLLDALGIVAIDEAEASVLKDNLAQLNEKFLPSVSDDTNSAKALAEKLQGGLVGVISGEFLSGNSHIFANQINENAKNFANYFLLSEMNHHLLEGLGHPLDLKSKLKFVLLNSSLYSEKIAKRLEITKEVLEKQGYQSLVVGLETNTKLSQAFEEILISSWTSFYLGLLNGADPAKIPWVDYFKEQLAKS